MQNDDPVLIVDDSAAIRQTVKSTLISMGYPNVHIASNGVEALEKCREHSFKVLFLDWNMPEMSGIEFLAGLRDAGSTVPFGFVTSEGSDEMRGRAQSAGASFLIAKPFTADTFRDALAEVLS